MKTTMTFTQEHIEELNKIAEMDCFAAKVAKTILSKEEYRASSKQVDILNEVSEIEFFISNDYSNRYEQEAKDRMYQAFRVR